MSYANVPGEMSEKLLIVPVDTAGVGVRLDHFLADRLPQYSRSILSSAIRAKMVLVADLPRKNNYRLKAGEIVTVFDFAKDLIDHELKPEPIDFPVLYEDDDLLFLCKPPGLVVHPGNGNWRGTLAHGLLYYCQNIGQVGGDGTRPGIVHRLDKDTSGVMVVAKHDEIHRLLVDMFKQHRLRKEYLAVVFGVPAEEQGEVIAPIGRHPVFRQKMAVCEQTGRYAKTYWQLQEKFRRNSLLKVRIETGRTHQIRVHLASLGMPVAGDLLYGGSRAQRDSGLFPRQMLHAHRLAFRHPKSGEYLDITAEPWPDLRQVLSTLREQQ